MEVKGENKRSPYLLGLSTNPTLKTLKISNGLIKLTQWCLPSKAPGEVLLY